MKPLSFFHLSASWYAAFFVQQKRPSKVTENRRNRQSLQRYKNEFHHRHFFPEILLRFGATTFVILEIFF